LSTEQAIRELKRRHSARLMQQRGVSAVGIEKDDSGGYVIAVHLTADDPDARKSLPDEIEGYPIRYVISGPFQKFGTGKE
jgi:hypothetical protein